MATVYNYLFCFRDHMDSVIRIRSSYGALHIFPVFPFLAEVLTFLLRDDNIFATNENIGKNMQADNN